jgi:gliding motility-associated-like protein
MPTGETSRMIAAKKQTTYSVMVTNADGCQSSDKLKIGSDCISTYYIPEAFTPNGDLLNDVFKPTLENVEEYSLSIYNRWGEKVYETKNIEQGWDGSYAGKKCDQGMYMYIMNFVTTEDMQYRQISGSLILLY